MATRKTRRPAQVPPAPSALTFTVANLGAEAQLVGGRARAAVAGAEQRLEALRRHAAQSALDWILAHEDRVEQFRRWSQGTPAGRALEAVLDELRAVAGPAPGRAMRRGRTTTPRKTPARAIKAPRSAANPKSAPRRPAPRSG